MHKNYLSISAEKKSEMFVIQFKTFGAFPFLHIPINSLNDQVQNLESVLGENAFSLRAAIKNELSPDEKLQIGANWLLNRFDVNKTPDEELISIIEKLRNRPEENSQSILHKFSKTQKHLIAQSKKYCGLTPKVLHRIFRFNEILQKIHQKENISWSQISYQLGYSDQSHFIKEFKRFSGFNPQEFIVNDLHKDRTNFFPLG